MRFASVFFTLFASAALGAEVSDDALDECQSRHSNFSDVQVCLAPTHIAIEMLESVKSEEFYGEAVDTVIEECKKYRESSYRIWICTVGELMKADELLKMVGDADRINDPIFAGLAVPGLFDQVADLENRMREIFSEQMVVPYRPSM